MSEPGAPSGRRHDRLGVHSLDHVGLVVPDINEARRFYEAFGLDVSEREGGLDVRAYGCEHVWLRLGKGSGKRIDYLSFGAFPDDVEHLAARLDRMDGARATAPAGTISNGVWFRDPHGMLVEVKAAPKASPDEKREAVIRTGPAGERGAAMRGETAQVRPLRLAHALFFTPDIERSVSFYQEVLGLRISDFPGPVAFLHGPHGSDHHLIAFAQSPVGIGYQHSAWDVSSIDEVGLGATQMAAAGYHRGWGLGRHVLGSNYFHYVRDPWGSYAEYSYDIDYVPAGQDWEAGYPSPENSLFLWGPDVPDDFVTNYERPTSA
jgi:catechol 2,3-dioxygenase